MEQYLTNSQPPESLILERILYCPCLSSHCAVFLTHIAPSNKSASSPAEYETSTQRIQACWDSKRTLSHFLPFLQKLYFFWWSPISAFQSTPVSHIEPSCYHLDFSDLTEELSDSKWRWEVFKLYDLIFIIFKTNWEDFINSPNPYI